MPAARANFSCGGGQFALHSRVPCCPNFVKYWLPPLLWMVIIYSGSSDAQSYHHTSTFFEPLMHWLFPSLSQVHVEFCHHLFRKCGHLTEYAMLCLLFWRAL